MATPASLKDVINNSGNDMARCAALRQAEALRVADHAESAVTADYAPGLQIIVVQNGAIEATVGGPQMQIEHDPLAEAELEPSAR